MIITICNSVLSVSGFIASADTKLQSGESEYSAKEQDEVPPSTRKFTQQLLRGWKTRKKSKVSLKLCLLFNIHHFLFFIVVLPRFVRRRNRQKIKRTKQEERLSIFLENRLKEYRVFTPWPSKVFSFSTTLLSCVSTPQLTAPGSSHLISGRAGLKWQASAARWRAERRAATWAAGACDGGGDGAYGGSWERTGAAKPAGGWGATRPRKSQIPAKRSEEVENTPWTSGWRFRHRRCPSTQTSAVWRTWWWHLGSWEGWLECCLECTSKHKQTQTTSIYT